VTRFVTQPRCASRARYPANDAEARAVTFIVECRTRTQPLAYEAIVPLLEAHHPGLGRGPRGRWSRYLVARIARRAGLAGIAPPTQRAAPAAPVLEAAGPCPEPVPSFDRVDWAALEGLARAFRR
jgi:hypothetical protein